MQIARGNDSSMRGGRTMGLRIAIEEEDDFAIGFSSLQGAASLIAPCINPLRTNQTLAEILAINCQDHEERG